MLNDGHRFRQYEAGASPDNPPGSRALPAPRGDSYQVRGGGTPPFGRWWRVASAMLVIATTLMACSSSPASLPAAPAGTRVLVALRLSVDQAGLEQLAQATADDRSREFHQFLSLSEIAARYGVTASVINTDEAVLHRDGISLTPDATRGALWGSVTAAQVSRFFGTQLVESNGGVMPSGQPQVPPGLKGITGIVGLDAETSSSPAVTGGSPSPACPADVPTRASVGDLFGFNASIARGDTGAGTSIDILAINDVEPAVFANYDRCAQASLNTDHIDRSVVPLTSSRGGGPEVSLDTLILTLLAPEAALSVLRFDPSTSLAFPLLDLVDQSHTPDVLDIAVTYCESSVGSSSIGLSEWLLAAIAATGTTTVAAAGDTGSSGCHPPNNALAVTYPASSDFVTAVGGVSYVGSAGAPDDLTVWNEPETWGGGGGTSAVIGAPEWQPHGHRQVPDIAADAVPGAAGSVPVCGSNTDCSWLAEGGTSLAATVLGAIGSLLSQQYSLETPRWGNIAAALWRHGANDAAVKDVAHGDNATFNGECCTAGPAYDRASGWGLFYPDQLGGVITH